MKAVVTLFFISMYSVFGMNNPPELTWLYENKHLEYEEDPFEYEKGVFALGYQFGTLLHVSNGLHSNDFIFEENLCVHDFLK